MPIESIAHKSIDDPKASTEEEVSFKKADLEPKVSPWFQRWGTVSQMASAVISLATLSAAIYGLNAASPIFKNKLLTEENARLTVESTGLSNKISEQHALVEKIAVDVRNLRLRGWNLVCATIAQSIPNGLSLFTANRDFERTIRVSESDMTFRLAISDAVARANFSVLTDDDLNAFKEFSRQYVEQLPSEYDRPVAGKLAGDEKGLLSLERQPGDFLGKCIAEGTKRVL